MALEYLGWRPGHTYKHRSSGSRGMAVSGHPLASAAGVEIMAAGGNAIDAAVATGLAVQVVEPFMSSIFGTGFMLIRLASGEVIALDNYARAPRAAYDGMYKPLPPKDGLFWAEGDLNNVGYLSVAVPGSLKAYYMAQRRYGRIDWEEVCAPAIRFAAEGFRASQYLVDAVAADARNLARFPDTAKVFLPGGNPPAVGQKIVRGELAESLRLIAREGSDALYKGALGKAVVEDMQANGGLITMDDLMGYEVTERTALRGTYRGHEIITMPPPSSGGTHLIQMLNIVEGFDLRTLGFDNPERLHLLAEAMKIAFADRGKYMGDPEQVQIPLDWLTDKGYAAQRRAEVQAGRIATPEAGVAPTPGTPHYESQETTHFTVADGEGNMVAATQTLNNIFGSRVTARGTGMLLNNAMRIFDTRPGLPNSVGPWKKMLSSMTPSFVLKDGRPYVSIGLPGGTRIFNSVFQAVLNLIDHGMSLQEAVEAPRIHTGTENEGLLVEEGWPEPVVDSLRAMGHPVQLMARVGGGMHAILFDEQGMLHGSACWRADGSPAGFSGGQAARMPGRAFFQNF